MSKASMEAAVISVLLPSFMASSFPLAIKW